MAHPGSHQEAQHSRAGRRPRAATSSPTRHPGVSTLPAPRVAGAGLLAYDLIMSLAGKTMFISGASRGIGLAIAKRAAQDGANIALLAKTAVPHPKLPGTIYTAAKEIEDAGGHALPIVGDVRDADGVFAAVASAVEQFGGIDMCVNNASALAPGTIQEVPMKRFDLVNGIQVRGTYAVSQACIPHMIGREPAYPHHVAAHRHVPRHLRSTAYIMAKYAMTICALGMAETLRDEGIASNTLWPRTLVATAAVQNLLGGDEAIARSRKPEVYSDAAYIIFNKSSKEFTGHELLCEDVWSITASPIFRSTAWYRGPTSGRARRRAAPTHRATPVRRAAAFSFALERALTRRLGS